VHRVLSFRPIGRSTRCRERSLLMNRFIAMLVAVVAVVLAVADTLPGGH
jgi:hypothetical protein